MLFQSDFIDPDLPNVVPALEAALGYRGVRDLQGDAVQARRGGLPAVTPHRPDRRAHRRRAQVERLPRIAVAEADRETVDRARAAPDDADHAIFEAGRAQ